MHAHIHSELCLTCTYHIVLSHLTSPVEITPCFVQHDYITPPCAPVHTNTMLCLTCTHQNSLCSSPPLYIKTVCALFHLYTIAGTNKQHKQQPHQHWDWSLQSEVNLAKSTTATTTTVRLTSRVKGQLGLQSKLGLAGLQQGHDLLWHGLASI